LLGRTAKLDQWGYPLNVFTSYRTSRSGVITWRAVEANCPAPRGPVRFEIGPLYFGIYELMDWDISYSRAHQKSGEIQFSPVLSVAILVFAFVFTRLIST
jgi:hypothetical protein